MKQILKTFFVLTACNAFGLTGIAQIVNYFSNTEYTFIDKFEKRMDLPVNFKAYQLNLSALKSELDKAPFEDASTEKSKRIIVKLPIGNGSFHDFEVFQTYVMHPELAAAIPYIKTFVAKGIDVNAYARLDYTVWGFHAMIVSDNGTTFIDPWNLGDDKNYICFYKHDARHTDAFVCETDDMNQRIEKHAALKSSGNNLRTYRLALACTGEYAAFYGGTKAGAFSGMVTSVNRVTGVYQKEVAVKLILVPNDTLLVYTNAATDPYTNNSGGTMLGQNITTCNSVIGSANYDIGHVFSTGGGGVAYLGVVCGSSKAGGVTGLGSPIGDNFDIDYVAHEMGHQFAGNHTFNSVTGSCNGNRASSAAYETGSGTTIMAYAGICGSDNTQPHSDPFFHTKSFDEIVNYTTTGNGNTCPVITSTGNTAPTVNAGINYTIPYLTPFVLTGSSSDANGDTITYCWEEYDLGPASTWNNPTGNAPIFRSFAPVNSASRTFPKLSDIVNNTTTIGEILPSYARNLQFRLTARDNRINGGGVTHNDTAVTLTVINTGAGFAVTYPNTALTWFIGTSDTVKWNVVGTNAAPINCSNVKILLSLDGGYTYPVTISANTLNDGSEVITIPNYPTTAARIKVEAIGNIFFDISNSNFTIANAAGLLSTITTGALTSNSFCAGSSLSVNFTADGPANAGNVFTAQLSNDTGAFISPINIGSITSISPATISAIIPPGTANGTGYRIRVVSSNPAVIGSNNGSNISISNLPLTPGIISGLSTVCQNQSSVTYTVPVVTNATGYVWTVPSGATITNGANTNSIVVSFNSNAVSGNITVCGTNTPCGNGPVATLAVTVNPLPGNATVIAGPSNVCQGQNAISFSVPAVTNATSYAWQLPAGASIINGAGTNSISVNFSASAVSGIVRVNGVNACGNGISSGKIITVGPTPLQPVVSPSGNVSVCSGDSVLLSTPSVAGLNYQWQLNNSNISGGNASGIYANQSGTYKLIASASQINAANFTSVGSVSIPDNNCAGATSVINVAGMSAVYPSSAISVTLNITHTWVGDLVLFLQSPSGELLGLSNQTGSSGNSGDNFTNTIFSDAGSFALPTTGAPYSGTYLPVQTVFTSCSTSTKTSFAALGAGGNLNPNGNWTLLAIDRASTDVGTINNWTISFASVNGCSSVSDSVNVATLTPTVWYRDFDNDLFGDALQSTSACTQPIGYVTDSTDCNDSSATSNPSAAEICGNNLDDNCNGSIDEGCCNIQISSIVIPVSCFGAGNGRISISVTNAALPVTYVWSNGSTVQNQTQLNPGSYTVSVTDANGCTATASADITQPDEIIFTGSVVNANCYGTFGSIDINVTSGIAPFEFAWSNGATSEDLNSAAAGNYTVVVTDFSGCTSTDAFSISEPDELTAIVTKTDVTCNGLANGTIDLAVAGGTNPMLFLWSDGNTNEDRVACLPGTYSVTVTDANGCSLQTAATITQPTVLFLSKTQVNVSCYGGNNGSVNLSVSGGKSPYVYNWTNGATTQDITNLLKGTYTVTVTDNNGCTKTKTAKITQPAKITLTSSVTNESLPGANDGTATVNVSGGVSPFIYSWNTVPVQTNQTATGLKAKTYKVTVADANGCTKSRFVIVGSGIAKLDEINAVHEISFTIAPNPVNDFVTLDFDVELNQKAKAELFDLSGRILLTKEINVDNPVIDLSDLATGLYLLKISSGNKTGYQKLMVE